jgi:hypothetical protein
MATHTHLAAFHIHRTGDVVGLIASSPFNNTMNCDRFSRGLRSFAKDNRPAIGRYVVTGSHTARRDASGEDLIWARSRSGARRSSSG